ncbi:hypothetical protein D3C75_1098490 [compost metagenome]
MLLSPHRQLSVHRDLSLQDAIDCLIHGLFAFVCQGAVDKGEVAFFIGNVIQQNHNIHHGVVIIGNMGMIA